MCGGGAALGGLSAPPPADSKIQNFLRVHRDYGWSNLDSPLSGPYSSTNTVIAPEWAL